MKGRKAKLTFDPMIRPLFMEDIGNNFSKNNVHIFNDDALNVYEQWERPTVIISDGAYGLGSFKGDPHRGHSRKAEQLVEWYEPHIRAWSERSTPETTLWLWNSELGWATLHPVLAKYGWRYVNCHVWDKGMGHVAGNSNTQTLRMFPIVTELCVQYVKEATVNGKTLQDWLRSEWERSGIPLSQSNKAAGVKNAATRKWLTKDHLWYYPPPDEFEKLVHYANAHGKPDGKPYFSINGTKPATKEEWKHMRSKFYCRLEVTNVWRQPPVNGNERIKNKTKSIHMNQKPLNLIERIIEASSDKGDAVWEPFGGLCTGAVASFKLGRKCYSAEKERQFYELAVRRLSV